MIYLKKFETEAQYTAAESSLILPNVSLITENDKVEYKPDIYKGHDYVEIGGLKWATMNIGASSVTDYGLYFQWGDTQGYTADQVGSGEGKKAFKWEDYKYGNGTSSPGATGMTKYNSTDGKTVLDLSDDAARANWGGQWRMPTEEEFQALFSATTNAWTSITVDNVTVSGRLFTDKTDSSKTLFFPARGNAIKGSMGHVGSEGFYWSSSLFPGDRTFGYRLYFKSDDCLMFINPRYFGEAVRGVVGQ